jgi:hypothetical protein
MDIRPVLASTLNRHLSDEAPVRCRGSWTAPKSLPRTVHPGTEIKTMAQHSQRTIKHFRSVCAVVTFALFAALTFSSVGVSDAQAADCGHARAEAMTRLSVGSGPGACWRPYSAKSPFNTKVTHRDRPVAGSKGIVKQLLSGGPISHFVAGDEARDYGIATFYSDADDPVYHVKCLEQWGTCALEGEDIHMPAEVRPSGVWPLESASDAWDSHMTVVDTTTGMEYDMWNVRSVGPNEITTSWGGKTPINGDGLGSDAVAARYGSLGGVIRAPELLNGHIRHALALNVPCTNGFEYPATKGGLECADTDMGTANQPAMGAHFQLKISKRKIRRMHLPAWKKAIVVALKRYGAYTTDTSGVADQWGLKFESPASYDARGEQNPFVSLARRKGLTPEDYNQNGQDEYWFDLDSGINWSKLRVVK